MCDHYNEYLRNRGKHGGDVYSTDVKLDFSVNINPLAESLPGEVRSAGERALSLLGQYPDIFCRKLSREIGKLENEDSENIVCSNGASEIFFAIVRAVKPQKAIILSPCFSGYSAALYAAGCKITEYSLLPENDFLADSGLTDCITEDADIIFLASPNNPTGKLVDNSVFSDIYEKCQKSGCLLVTDACFHQISEGGMLYGDILVKAFTKVMSMPGVRLGYAIIRDRILREKVRQQLPEWNVSVLAQEMGCAAAHFMANTSFLDDSVSLIRQERRYLTESLSSCGFMVFDSDTNFILLYSQKELFEPLLRQGILIRDASDFCSLKKGYYRIAVRKHDDNVKLIEAVKRNENRNHNT